MIGFVLSGGANLGSVHVGMVKALLEEGLKPDVIVGTSIGSVNAGFLAADPSLEQVERLRELWCEAKARDIFPLNPLANCRALFKQGSLFSPHCWRRFVERRAPYRNIEDAAVPLRITATDYEEGRSVVFDSGPVVEAVMASTALPGVFPPYRIGDRWFLDGAISEQLPLKVALDAGARTIYVMAVSVPSPPPDRRSPLAVLRHAITILLFPRIRLDALDLPGEHPNLKIVQVPSVKTQVSLWDMSRHDELIATAYETTKKFLEAEHDQDERIDVATVP
ncbi:MAG TPA: patatin-like phospholipase family protein, partial [Acidimicrobiia bacterium]|nr:patatin-like phospholipase family protein [Acidimicrobiia bacterium]